MRAWRQHRSHWKSLAPSRFLSELVPVPSADTDADNNDDNVHLVRTRTSETSSSQPGVARWLEPQLLSESSIGASFTVMQADAVRGSDCNCLQSSPVQHGLPGSQRAT